MEEEFLKITEEQLETLSPEELVDLKFELEEMLAKIEEVIESCE